MDDRIISDSLSFNDSIAEEKVNTKFLAACKNGTLYAVKPTEKNIMEYNLTAGKTLKRYFYG